MTPRTPTAVVRRLETPQARNRSGAAVVGVRSVTTRLHEADEPGMLLKSGWSYEYLKLSIDAVRFVMEHPLLTASTGGMLETVDAPQPPPMTLLQMLESLERLIKGREAAMKLVRLNIAAADQAQKILDANRV